MIRINVRDNVIGVCSRTAVLTPARTSQLINDSDFQNGEQVAAAVSEEAYERDMADQNQSIRITALDAKLDKAFIKRTASGAVASFDDGGDDLPVKSLVVNIDPVQGGSGDPYPAGGGTNILPPFTPGTYSGTNMTVVVDSSQLITVTGTLAAADRDEGIRLPLSKSVTIAGSEYMHYRNSTAVSGVEAYFDDGSGWSDLSAQNAVAAAYAGGITGLDLVFHPPLEGSVAYNFTMQLSVEATNAATDWTPYENIRPISGWIGARVTRYGKNLLDEAAFYTYSNWSDTLVDYGAGNAQTSVTNRAFAFPTVSGETYTISFGISAASFPTYLYLCRANGADTAERIVSFSTGSFSRSYYTFTAEDGWFYYMRLGGINTAELFANQISKVSYAQLELGSAATEHGSYRGEVFNVAFPAGAGTVYGGTLDVTNGLLTVDRAMVDLGTLTWENDPDGQGFVLSKGLRDRIACPGSPGAFVSIRCSALRPTTAADIYNGANGIGIHQNGDVRVRYTGMSTDPAVVKSELSGVMLCYPLAANMTYNLAPQDVTTLLGANSILADTGDVAVIYRADPTLVIEKLASVLQA